MYNPFNNPDDFDMFAEAVLASFILFSFFIIGGLA